MKKNKTRRYPKPKYKIGDIIMYRKDNKKHGENHTSDVYQGRICEIYEDMISLNKWMYTVTKENTVPKTYVLLFDENILKKIY